MNARAAIATNSQETRVRLFFDQTSDEQFLVVAEVLSSNAPGESSQLSIHTFQHEDLFLSRLVFADLSVDDTALLAGTVIRSVDQFTQGRNWVEVSLSREQIAALGLDLDKLFVYEGGPPPMAILPSGESAFAFADNSSQFYQFLMSSPTPFVMLSGPEHRFTFINQPYVELIGQSTQHDILMKPVREVLPELDGQPFFRWLDEVYETGTPRIGKEQTAYMRRLHGAGFENRYFDFIYYPVRNTKGDVYGVMVQAADVTEKVQAAVFSEYREETLFRQWAELDAIYRTAPVGMALLDAKSLRLLRLNPKQAEMMGASVDDLLGKQALDLKFIPASLAEAFRQVKAGRTIRNAIVERAFEADENGHRTWLVNISPFLGASGEVLAYTAISLEVPDEP